MGFGLSVYLGLRVLVHLFLCWRSCWIEELCPVCAPKELFRVVQRSQKRELWWEWVSPEEPLTPVPAGLFLRAEIMLLSLSKML